MFRHLREFDSGSPAFARQREAIITRCLPLADHIALRFRNRGQPLDDLKQVARMGLVNAVNRYNPDYGAEFVAFAVPTVMGEVRRHFRDHGWSVKVPRRLKDLHIQISAARAELTSRLNRSPTATEIAEYLERDREEIVEAIVAGSGYASMSTDTVIRGDDESRPMIESLGDLDGRLDNVLLVETVRPLLAALPDRDRTLINLRFFEEMSQTQIAEQLGISQMHVSRLLSRALTALRERAREPDIA